MLNYADIKLHETSPAIKSPSHPLPKKYTLQIKYDVYT